MKHLIKIITSIFLSIFCLTNTVFAIDLPEESLHYDISFLWFKKAAEGKITFKRNNTNNDYTAVLEAETLGFIGFITSYRKYIYISHLMYDENLNRLISIKFERIEIVGNKIWQSISSMDYETNKIINSVSFTQKLIKETIEDIPPTIIYEDILSALFNFRFGFLGNIEKGKNYVVKGIPDKGIVDYSIYVSSQEEEIAVKKKLGIEEGDGYMLLVKVPGAIFKSKGIVWIWFTKDLLPLTATVEDAIVFGDITGILTNNRTNLSLL
ncbi:MAG: hypothetical protein A3I04_07485 [Nitrospinae bacterium RIFCSPLOWO2_02_FULL_39_110]|nr:MAG: hypothetical protein A2W53_09195 [Nitrospinae bacterium RIFCSPHIGHO2_02_39_11]OGV99533.1 MAG: hypothetical protein A3D97_04795 [Nitrospinae bacterium RIFCSPHIGHO2_12_FULL_39_42]OGV99985.1 MAG: hypothetical protein A3D20_05715 [Nitrospinae bacterium RIFCSPHIGHO2_02_FULL_39_82]OGW05923.1 MAG: hypothetical protein A2Z59_06880 [Nitrospinae bacterium RIFCSPLOWO2_02_39_17]OGW06217.1 MAG: hypothetical protein A3I04_07485 [Nitrospinae bacterium RIFCSPLOWO2_02_FULL_39_110]OGW08658.1 MAG: hypoth